MCLTSQAASSQDSSPGLLAACPSRPHDTTGQHGDDTPTPFIFSHSHFSKRRLRVSARFTASLLWPISPTREAWQSVTLDIVTTLSWHEFAELGTAT